MVQKIPPWGGGGFALLAISLFASFSVSLLEMLASLHALSNRGLFLLTESQRFGKKLSIRFTYCLYNAECMLFIHLISSRLCSLFAQCIVLSVVINIVVLVYSSEMARLLGKS